MNNLSKAIKYYETASIKNIHISGSKIINMPELLKDLQQQLEQKDKEIEQIIINHGIAAMSECNLKAQLEQAHIRNEKLVNIVDEYRVENEQLQKDKAELRERNIQIDNWCNEQTGEIRRLTKAFNQVGDSNE